MTFQDLTGAVVGTLRVTNVESRQPLRWRATCSKCGMSQVYPHGRLRDGYARCLNVHCGEVGLKPNISDYDQRELVKTEAEQVRQAAVAKQIEEARKREAARLEQEARYSALRPTYLPYWYSCLEHDVTPISLDEWGRLGIDTREQILEIVDQGLPVAITKYVTQFREVRSFR
jgi:hypothetical protein